MVGTVFVHLCREHEVGVVCEALNDPSNAQETVIAEPVTDVADPGGQVGVQVWPVLSPLQFE